MRESQIVLLIIDLEQEEVRKDNNGHYQIINKEKSNKNNDEILQKKGDCEIFNYDEVVNENTIIIINKSDKLSQQ